MIARLLLIAALPLCAQNPSSSDTLVPPSPRAVELREIVLSPEHEVTMRAVVNLAEACGGWFQSWTADQVELRVPRDSVARFEERLAGLGRRLDRRYSTVDLSEEFADQIAGLNARARILAQWEQLLGQSRDAHAALDIQKELVVVAGELDQRRGALTLLRDRVAFARVTLDFQFQGRSVSGRDGRTAFPWLNRLDLSRLQEGFR